MHTENFIYERKLSHAEPTNFLNNNMYQKSLRVNLSLQIVAFKDRIKWLISPHPFLVGVV